MKRILKWQDWPVLGRWDVSPDHPALEGHFPGMPVVPGALLLSWFLQQLKLSTGCAVVEIKESRFSGVALPGAQLESRVSSNGVDTRFAIVDISSEPARVVASGWVVLASEESAA